MNKVLVPLSQNATRLENKVLSILRLFQICVSALFSRFQKLFSFLTETSGTRIFCQKSSWTNLKTIVIQTFSSHFEKHLDPVLTWCLQSLWTKQKTWEYSEQNRELSTHHLHWNKNNSKRHVKLLMKCYVDLFVGFLQVSLFWSLAHDKNKENIVVKGKSHGKFSNI